MYFKGEASMVGLIIVLRTTLFNYVEDTCLKLGEECVLTALT